MYFHVCLLVTKVELQKYKVWLFSKYKTITKSSNKTNALVVTQKKYRNKNFLIEKIYKTMVMCNQRYIYSILYTKKLNLTLILAFLFYSFITINLCNETPAKKTTRFTENVIILNEFIKQYTSFMFFTKLYRIVKWKQIFPYFGVCLLQCSCSTLTVLLEKYFGFFQIFDDSIK